MTSLLLSLTKAYESGVSSKWPSDLPREIAQSNVLKLTNVDFL